MRSQAAAGRATRVKKLAKNTAQQVLREDQLDSAEYSSLQTQSNIETGVEKSEEKEYHLQAALKGGSGGSKDAEEIPAPPAEETPGLDYDALYPLVFHKPATYIRFSQTVEETTGCQYNMTSEDDTFLKAYNHKKSAGTRCSEDDFEKIMEVFEDTAADQVPYASLDGTVISFDGMKMSIKQQIHEKAHPFAKDIYEHWRICRQNAGNHPLQPSLKVEKNIEKDDGDPYVCFRRRDARQTRKTRARDTQSVEKLKRLRKELDEGRQLIDMAFQRELTKRELLKCDKSVFEQRAKVKETKVKLGIKTDDEDLINQRPQKRKMTDFGQLQRPPGSQLRLPGRSDGRPLDADLIMLSDLMAQKENTLQIEIEEKAQQHRKWNMGHVDLTREPLSPVHGQGFEAGFRPATAQYQYLMTPPSSVTSESFDQPSPSLEKPEPCALGYNSPSEEEEPRGQPAYRRRIGRGGRLWIDRRGMSSAAKLAEATVSDRWKYDQDDDDEQPVYEMDPYDTKALRFRATIPYPPHLFSQRPRPEQAGPLARVAGNSPAHNRAITAAGQQPQQAPP
ncbi:putative enhancer of polycomb-like protein 1 [Mollisia scopiformis]|uniref:Enhancer of polycomb-like protein n=1 Tax=Mollisia scopiformis TaxID=149040 RepID=A0A194XJA9_MOLSC|nr:putative enhancer of polycomb-like protein 1 [Mollisia scopiformis]KUJ20211.1 putative enhancer of polycomb-like protein 1 [Mollisia scopiformis]